MLLERMGQRNTDWPFLEESVSGLAIKQFAAGGGELVHLVCLVCLVRLVGKRNKPDKLDKLPGVVPRRSSDPFNIHHSTLSIPTPPSLTQGSHKTAVVIRCTTKA